MTRRSITDDVNINDIRPLPAPEALLAELPLHETTARQIIACRQTIKNIIHGRDDRLLAVVGPCSIHDPQAALEYAQRLQASIAQFGSELFLVMRVYFEKPRTTIGWKGLINDPGIDGTFNINHGLRTARKLLLQIAELGLPAGCEILDIISPQFFSDLLAWGAIGARTTESQIHRQMASGLSMPIGFKNGTDGNTQIAVDAVAAASQPHHFLAITKQGVSAIAETRGNRHGHIILRGASHGPNYDSQSIANAVNQLQAASLPPRLMVDCSHGNSNKDFRQQPAVAEQLAAQLAGGSEAIFGVMIESNLHEGKQAKPEKYGVSITDGCISWETTVATLAVLAEGVKARRLVGGV